MRVMCVLVVHVRGKSDVCVVMVVCGDDGVLCDSEDGV